MITPRIKPSGFFPEEAVDDLFLARQRKAKLEGYVQTLAAIDALVDFTAMASAVDAACPRADRSKGGRPPYPSEALVRMVFLQGLYNLSDEQCEHQVLDRLSFQRFCRLEGALNIPDARTLWAFRQRLAEGGLGGKAIFESLSRQLQQHGFIARGGQIVDASIVSAPVTQANTAEREALNRGEDPEGWSKKRLAHTDGDARWTQKHGKSYYGYKLHGNVDARYARCWDGGHWSRNGSRAGGRRRTLQRVPRRRRQGSSWRPSSTSTDAPPPPRSCVHSRRHCHDRQGTGSRPECGDPVGRSRAGGRKDRGEIEAW